MKQHKSLEDARGASTVTELVVAASLLVSLIGASVPLVVKSGRLWQETREHELAIDELSNQLERLTALPDADRDIAIAELKPSNTVQATLVDVRIESQTIRDKAGERLLLTIDWDRTVDAKPLSLVGWLTTKETSP